MVAPARTIRVFASSPGDLDDERSQLAAVVEELNSTIRALIPDRNVRLELIRWESHTHPDLGATPQDVVDAQLGHDFDVFVGMMWSRFGTPTARAGSGTEHEFREAYGGWERQRRPAHILFYFCTEPIDPDVVLENAGQYTAMKAFRAELQAKGLIGSYASHSDFATRVRRDLALVVGRLLHPGEPSPGRKERAAERPSSSDLAVIREEIAGAAHEYEEIRSSMEPSSRRTRRMEVVASGMRTLAPSSVAILPELIASDSPGHRLAAVTTLQVIPEVHYLKWLAERIPAEKPFIGYHAAVALLSAARELPDGYLAEVAAAVGQAEAMAAALPFDSDRATTLRYARDELERRGVDVPSPLN